MSRHLIGTPFEEEELNKKMNVHSQKAKDPLGNTRWKGAFTGGFEAGYRNTCGTKQGWVPSSFVSSVLNRADKKQQNIFDYMDKEDFGREEIGQNISVQKNFTSAEANNPFSISTTESMGERILAKLKKEEAFLNAPEDIDELQKLLENYEHEEVLETRQNQSNSLKSIENFYSVGARAQPLDDDFIAAYEDFFKKVIRASVKEESEEEIAKRREENKIYFDFTKPLEEQSEYLKEIQELEDVSQPKKRRKNVLNEQKLKDLFKMAKLKANSGKSDGKIDCFVPDDYDPYHRIKDLQLKEKQFIESTEEKKKHRIHNVTQRSDVLGEGKLSSKFISASKSLGNNKFVRSMQQQKIDELEKVFEDVEKNKRYWDYVMDVEGKKISAQMDILEYEQAEKEKQQFQRTYKLKGLEGEDVKNLPHKINEELKSKSKEVKVIRKTGTWKPERLLCKRFGCALPYKQQSQIKLKF